MKRLAGLVFALAAALGPAGLRAQSIPVGPGGELSSIVGLPFDVPIVADMTARTEKLGAFAARLQWDAAALRFDAGLDGSFGGTTVNGDSVVFGIVRIAGVNPSGAAGRVTLGIGRFTPLVNDTTTLLFTLTELFAAGTFADLMPSAVVSNGLYCPARGRFGDIDADGNANSRDALIALSNAVGLPTSPFDIGLGDVDADGATNARDALIILSSAVGLDVSAFRVLRLAGGSCAANASIAMSITPAAVDLVLGQEARLEARAADPSGALQTLPDVVWKSSNPSVAAVLNNGTVIARDTGTALITALRGVTDSAQASVTVVAGRSLHLVDAAAVAAVNQLGSLAFPFPTIAQALALADSGDTIEIRPGNYPSPVLLDRDITLLGDTLPDGTRPLIAGVGDPYYAGPGVLMTGTGSRRVFNLAFQNLYDAVEVNGPGSVLLRGLRSVTVENGVVTLQPMTSLRVEESQLVGRGVSVFDSDGLQVNDRVDTLVIQNTEIGDFGASGVTAGNVDSIAILGSNLHDFGYYGLELGGYGQSLALVVDSSTIQRSYYELFYVQDLRSAVFTRNVLISPDDDMFYQYQENISSGGFVSFQGDSILCEDYSWIDISDLDSLIVDSVKVLLPDGGDGDVYNVPYVRVTRSSFLQLEYDALDVYGYAGGVVEVKNSTFVGDPRCDLCGSGLEVEDARTTVDSSTFVNLYEPIYVYGDSSLTVTNSLFRRVGYGVEWYGDYYVGCTFGCNANAGVTITNNTFDGYYYAIEAFDGVIVVDSNTFLGGSSFAIDVGAAQAIQVTRNVIQGVEEGMFVYAYDSSITATIADNVLTGITEQAIYADGDTYPDSIRPRFEILRNQVSCVRTSSYGSGIEMYDADGVIADNALVDCAAGVYVQTYDDSLKSDSILRNTIALGPDQDWGIYLFGKLRSRVTQNVLTADTLGFSSYPMIYASEYYFYPGGVTLVDSNVVTGGVTGAIYVYGYDTVAVGANTVEDVAGYGLQIAGNVKLFNGVSGNAFRRLTGDGIHLFAQDTATARVDSNLVRDAFRGIVVDYLARGDLTRNTVTNSASHGIELAFGSIPLSIALNNITGNRGYGLYDGFYGSSAPNNWWGDALGPRCASGCDTLSTGDSVTTTVSFTPWLTSPNPSSPPSTAARRLLATRAAALRAAPAVASQAGRMPPARSARPTRERRAPEVRRAVQPPAGMPAERVQRIQARLESLTSREAARQLVDSRREAEGAGREAALRERLARVRSEAGHPNANAPAGPGGERRP